MNKDYPKKQWRFRSDERQMYTFFKPGKRPAAPPEAFKFTMVRNPIHRTISHYYQCSKKNPPSECYPEAKNGFEEFVKEGSMAGNLLNHYLKPSESSKNASADDVLRAFDLVLLTEDFDRGLVMLHLILQLPPRHMIYHWAKSRPQNDAEEPKFPEAVRCGVLERTKRDVALYALAKRRYEATVAAFGERLTRAANAYTDMLGRYHEACKGTMLQNGVDHWRDSTECRETFCSTDPTCKRGKLVADS
jgi:hypothetical protein